jgi:hypothetical protein
MNKVEFLNTRLEDNYSLDSTILYAFINALSPEEVCRFLDSTYTKDPLTRRYVLNRIASDITNSYAKHHKKLILDLLIKLDEKKSPLRTIYASALNALYSSLPPQEKKTVLTTFLSSSLKAVREKAYKKLRAQWDNSFEENIRALWEQHHEIGTLILIINHFNEEYLVEHYKNLMSHCNAPQQAKLFIRIGQNYPKLLNELKESDEISYTYALTKLNMHLTTKEASVITKNNIKDERIGLLIWCYGKMGLWANIVEYDNLTKTMYPLNYT